MTTVELPDAVEDRVLVLHPGDIIILRHKNRVIAQDEAEQIKDAFAKSDITAFVVGLDWDIVREPSGVDTDA